MKFLIKLQKTFDLKKLQLFFAACMAGTLSAQSAGDVIGYHTNVDLTPSGVASFIGTQFGTQTPKEIIDFLSCFRIGLKAYRVEYYTPNEKDVLVKATGLLIVPQTNYKLSTVVSTHATTDGRDKVPSNLPITTVLEMSYALNGYIVMAPDYVGMGGGEGVHPYVNGKTEASATLDFVKAANKVIDQIGGIKRYDEYFLTGYSQGGHATMATLKRASETGELKFRYVYAGSGPYDLSYSTLKLGLLDKTEYPIPPIPAYLMNMCQMTGYKLYQNDPAEIIEPGYVQDYRDYAITGAGGFSWGNKVWRKMIKPEFINSLITDPNHPLRLCLKANDNYDWYNKTPTIMGYSSSDSVVNNNSASVAETAQRKYYPWWDCDKNQIKKFGWGPFEHIGGAIPYLLASNYTFNTVRKGGFFNVWALLTTRLKSNSEQNTFRKSDIDVDQNFKELDEHMKIEEVYHFGSKNINARKNFKEGNFNESVFVEKLKVNQLSELETGVYLVKAKINGETKEIPFVKSTPETVEYRHVVKDDSNNRLVLNILSENIDHINLIKNRKIIKTVGANEYKANGIVLTGYELDPLIFEVVTKNYTIQFQKARENGAVKANDIDVIAIDSSLQIIASTNIREISVYDMSGKTVYHQTPVNNTSTQTKSLLKGVYVVKAILDNNKIISKKAVL